MAKVSRRTIASASPELQTLFRLLAAFGVDNWRMARVLIDVDFRFEVAARILRIPSATIRQRVHRAQAKAMDILGGRFVIQKRLRAAVRFGADDNGVYRMAAAASSERSDMMDPAEAAELAEEQSS